MDSIQERAQSETLGVVMLLGITILTVTALVLFGGAAIDNVEQSVDVQSAKLSMSQLDAKISHIALSGGIRQVVPLRGGQSGTYTVRPDAGQVTIRHINYSSTNATEVLYNASLGTVRYVTDNTVIAYQAGGVFPGRINGGSSLISPPTFYYQGMTLTFPVIRVDGDGSVSGAPTAIVTGGQNVGSVYPDQSQVYDGINRQYVNPVQTGRIRVSIESQFYRAWASFFRTRTAGRVHIHSANETVVISLVSPGTYGEFQLPMDGEPIELRALSNAHPIENFTVTIVSDQPDSQEFSGLSWSLWARKGNQKFELSLSNKKGGDDDIAVAVYYSNGTAEQGWYDEDAFEVQTNANGAERIIANLTSTENVTYTEVGANELTKFTGKGNIKFANPVTFNEHTIDNNTTFEAGDSAVLGFVVNHYIQLMGPNVDLIVKDGESAVQHNPAGNVNEDASSGYLTVATSGKYVRYLYVTENNVTVRIH